MTHNVQPLPANARKVFQGLFFSVWQWEQQLYDGSMATFERVARPDSVFAISVTPEGKILLTKDTQPDRAMVITGPGGIIETGETPLQAVARELLEETGYEAETYVPWFSYRPSSKTECQVHAFIARGAMPTREPALDPGEQIEIMLLEYEEFLALGRSDDLRDWMLRIKLLEAQVDEQQNKELHHLLYD